MKELTLVCCACDKVHNGERWVDAGEFFYDVNKSTHGYCPECFDKAMYVIKNRRLMRLKVPVE